jgi:hypothetical protein
MEKDHRGEGVQGQEEDVVVAEGPAEWVGPGPALVLEENVFAHPVEQRRPIRLDVHATMSGAPTAEPPW